MSPITRVGKMGLYAWIINITAKIAPRGVIQDNIFVVKSEYLTKNIWSKDEFSPI